MAVSKVPFACGARGAACGALLLLAAAGPAPAFDPRSAAPELSPSAIVINEDDRLGPAEFGAAHGLTAQQVATRFGATGVVRCGGAVGTAQLVGSTGVIVTAAHVLFEPGGGSRAKGGGCTFDIVVGGKRTVVPILASEVVCGATEPYGNPAIRDWAVAPLQKPVAGARPYTLASPIGLPSRIVLAAAARSGGEENHSLELCSARKVTATSPSGVREVAIDCDAEGGASGAALLTESGGFAGVYVGFRSAHPGQSGPFSMSHYNFGVTAEGALRKAIMEVVSKSQPRSASR